MEVIGKKINYIKLHNFLDRLEVNQVYSSLHTFYNTLIVQVNHEGNIEWQGHIFSKEALRQLLKEEDGIIKSITFTEHIFSKYEVIINFESGNEYVIKIDDQEKYAAILKFLIEYKE